MRSFVALCALTVLAVSQATSADEVDVAKARAKASLDLMLRQRERDDIQAAKIQATAALNVLSKGRECMDDVGAAVEKARMTGKLIFVWVGFDCKGEPAIRAAFPDAVHCHADELNGDKTQRIVAGPVGNTQRFERSTFNKDTPATIRQAIQALPPKLKLSAVRQVITTAC